MATTKSPLKSALLDESEPRSGRVLDGHGLKITIISTHWFDEEVVRFLAQSCKDELLHCGVASEDITHLQVPGVFELPFAASQVIHSKRDQVDVVIGIGCMVQGATITYEIVSKAATMGLMKLNIQTDTPVVCALLTCQSLEEAKAMVDSTHASISKAATSKGCNFGAEWAKEALELAQLKRSTGEVIKAKCRCTCHCADQECSCVCHCKQCNCRVTCTDSKCQCSSCFTHQAKGGGVEPCKQVMRGNVMGV